MQAVGRQSCQLPDGVRVQYERHRPEQTTLYRLVQEHAATFFAQVEAAAGAGVPQFVKDEFEAFLECGILAHGFLRLRCGDCGHDKLVAFARHKQSPDCLCPGSLPAALVRQWVLSLPIPLRLLPTVSHSLSACRHRLLRQFGEAARAGGAQTTMRVRLGSATRSG
jgi:hypothetical protein